jgi:hypothetical protein
MRDLMQNVSPYRQYIQTVYDTCLGNKSCLLIANETRDRLEERLVLKLLRCPGGGLLLVPKAWVDSDVLPSSLYDWVPTADRSDHSKQGSGSQGWARCSKDCIFIY